MTTWFTSDQHFGHRNIISYSSRPFRDVEEMNLEIVRRHNEVVEKDDLVYHLGDLSLSERIAARVVPLLHGRKVLLPGNHDGCHPCHRKHAGARERYLAMGFEEVLGAWPSSPLVEVPLPSGRKVLLNHMPYAGAGDHSRGEGGPERYAEYRPPDEGRVLLHGHVHEAWKTRWRSRLGSFREKVGMMINVGVDQWDFYPVHEETIEDLIETEEVPR